MELSVSEIKFFKGSNGTGMRCSVTISDRHPERGEIVWTTRGCLVMRDVKTKKLTFMPPVTTIRNPRYGNKDIRYHANIANENLSKWICDSLEPKFGSQIKLFSKNEKPVTTAVDADDLGLPDEVKL